LRATTESQPQHQTQNLSSILKEHPVFVVVSLLVSALVAIATIAASGGYAVERWHDTTATVDFSGEIDQKKPFAIPLVVKNPSSIFSMHLPRMTCAANVEYADEENNRALIGADQGPASSRSAIEPGSTRNYYCDLPGALEMRAANDPKGPLIPKKADMLVAIDYETWMPVSTIQRRVVTQFVMVQTTSGFRWIKGDWIGGHRAVVWPVGTEPPWKDRLKW
jgi:hypothetical protein